jgi:hypothetical protein
MTKIVYANGDSFIAGMECLGHGDRAPENKELAFPKHVAVALGAEQYINNAYSGATNDFIFRRTIVDLQQLEATGISPSDVFVIVGFTALHRIEVDGQRLFEGYTDLTGAPIPATGEFSKPFPPDEYVDYGTVFINPNNMIMGKDRLGKIVNMADNIYPFCTRYLWTNYVQAPAQRARIHALHTLLTLKGYKHIILSTCSDEIEFPNNSNFFNPLNMRSFYEYAISLYPEERREHNHFSPIPHKAYADELITHIKENIL